MRLTVISNTRSFRPILERNSPVSSAPRSSLREVCWRLSRVISVRRIADLRCPPAQLRQFLSDLTGADPRTVHAVIGKRAPLELPAEPATELTDASTLQGVPDEAAWERLSQVPHLQKVARRRIARNASGGRNGETFSEATLAGGADIEAGARASRRLRQRQAICRRASLLVSASARLRAHPLRSLGFLRSNLPRPAGDPPDWNFGKIFVDQCEVCNACGAPVLEVRI